MEQRIEDVLSWQEVHRDKFLVILESEAKLISLQDIMQASLFLSKMPVMFRKVTVRNT